MIARPLLNFVLQACCSLQPALVFGLQGKTCATGWDLADALYVVRTLTIICSVKQSRVYSKVAASSAKTHHGQQHISCRPDGVNYVLLREIPA